MPGSSAARGRSTHLVIAVVSAGLALAAFLSTAAIAAARPHGAKTQTVLYVSPTGSDSGACTTTRAVQDDRRGRRESSQG